ncbi:ABC transporter ATP-binding protein [Aliarcobacter butzleri]|uniref:ABC transporter ATP-binding protein n=1 Tax=Aliarcobacter butzleri TaxID=28197 RepID=UPI0021B17855|nr:ABC transporter ATP-binding protein [Aliarcobacter butzleri]MCT7550977.1 ABC transporter ATP-binding protein [Aliarcobacter butzleri]MCT7559947.1 ABC transporter ATP-binding protein [Aliarcobacter butzleri]
MNKNTAVSLQNISKVYKLYDKPIDRLKESLHPLKKKYHKDFYALKNINLEIKKGEVLGIVGVNGAGKSTLLKIISGVLTPSSGRVNIHGRINAILELGSSLKPEMTGRENIRLNLQINGIEKDREKITDEIIEFADIGEHIDQPVKSYSSGMTARLGFGIATSTDPDVLIVDEVLAVGDVLFQRKCYSRIEKLFKDGKTVIFVSHSAQSVVEFCSRAILLYDREIIMDDTPKKVTDYYQKLVFSKDKQKVLDEINGKVEIKNKEQKQEVKEESRKNKNNELIKDFQINPIKLNNDFFDFKDVCIKNLSGDIVNNIIENKYYIEYKVIIKKNLSNVYFGAQVKTLKGFIVSGINSKEQLGVTIDEVLEREEYTVKISFDNKLLTSTYILMVFAKWEDELSFQDNAFIFKVQKKNFNQAGVVTLNQEIQIYKNGENIFEK